MHTNAVAEFNSVEAFDAIFDVDGMASCVEEGIETKKSVICSMDGVSTEV